MAQVIRDRLCYNITSQNEPVFRPVVIPEYIEPAPKTKKQRPLSSADILNRTHTTKYRNKIRQLRALAAAPTEPVKKMKTVKKSPNRKKSPGHKKPCLQDVVALTSQDMYELKRTQVLSKLHKTEITESDLPLLQRELRNSNTFRVLCATIIL